MEWLRYTALVLYGLSAIVLVTKITQMVMCGISPPLWMRIVTTLAALCFGISMIDIAVGVDSGLFAMRVIWNLIAAMIFSGTMYTVYWKKDTHR